MIICTYSSDIRDDLDFQNIPENSLGRIFNDAFGTESQTFGAESAPKAFRKRNRIFKLAFGTESSGCRRPVVGHVFGRIVLLSEYSFR